MFLSRRAQGAAKGRQARHRGGLILEPQPGYVSGTETTRGLTLVDFPFSHHSAHSHAYGKGYWMNEKDLVSGQVIDGCTDGEMSQNGQFSIKTSTTPKYTSHLNTSGNMPALTASLRSQNLQLTLPVSPCGFSAQPPPQ